MNSENQNKEPQKRTGGRKKGLSITYFLGGKVLTEDYIIKQSGLLFWIFILILAFITNRYFCAKQLTEMDRLKKELIDLENENVNLNSRLTRNSRQFHIEESLRKQGIDLSKGNKTVYEIRK